VIVVDNALPEDIADRCLVHRFAHGDGFIKGLSRPHYRPGEQEELPFDDARHFA
jgi:hypothetical protein